MRNIIDTFLAQIESDSSHVTRLNEEEFDNADDQHETVAMRVGFCYKSLDGFTVTMFNYKFYVNWSHPTDDSFICNVGCETVKQAVEQLENTYKEVLAMLNKRI